MTNLDRLERRLPDLMAELSPPRVPDYFDDIVQVTARTRQRPAWASLERWLPVDITARSAPFGLPSWRPVLTLVVIVALLVAAGAMLLAGSKRPLPPMFGPARNGAVIYSTNDGDILSLNAATGTAVPIVGGATDDRYPSISPDGGRILFLRLGQPDMIYTANADGSGVQAVATAKEANWAEFSPDGQRLVYIAEGGGTPQIRDFATGTSRPLPVGSAVHAAPWLTNDELLVIAEPTLDGDRTFWTINADGSGQHLLATPDACCGASVLAGGGLLAYTSGSRIHVLDIATGNDRKLASTEKPGLLFLDPTFSPDGKWLFVKQFVNMVPGVQPALIAVDGTGPVVPIGPSLPENSSEIRAAFSPDGTQILMSYDDGSAWLFAVPSGQGTKVDWAGVVNMTWQRVALP